MRYSIICFAGFLVFAVGCKEQPLVSSADIQPYLQASHPEQALAGINEEENFWLQQLNDDTASYINHLALSKVYLSRFGISAGIDDLNKGEFYLNKAASRLNYRDPGILQSLSRLAITRHRFREADVLNEQSLTYNGNPYTYTLAAFDASMELGLYKQSARLLNRQADKASFHYLVRLAKKQDQEGDLDKAIISMEKAFEKIKHTNNTDLYCWTLANLGDMYGHAGRIKEAYHMYKLVLETDPAYMYALKGIAWIAYAHDRNIPLARSINEFISRHTHDPSVLLQLAELAAYEGDTAKANNYKARFIREASDPAYGTMHHKYLVQLLAEDQATQARALAIARQEVEDRETPETWSWLAWAYYAMGDFTKAGQIFTDKVLGKTFEPGALVIGVYILEKINRQDVAAELYKECMASAFELGPVQVEELKQFSSRLKTR